jgi:hypothetical protein
MSRGLAWALTIEGVVWSVAVYQGLTYALRATL